MLNLFDGSCLIHRLNVHRHNLARLHVQEILQHLIREIRCCDLQISHGSLQISHRKSPAAGEGERGGCDKILHGESGASKPAPVKKEAVMVAHVKHGMHQLQALPAV